MDKVALHLNYKEVYYILCRYDKNYLKIMNFTDNCVKILEQYLASLTHQLVGFIRHVQDAILATKL